MLLRVSICVIAFILKFVASVGNVAQGKEVIELIQDGLRDQPAHPSGRAIVLIGLTGSGKTTLAKFITGDNNRLVSVAAPSQVEPTPCPDPDLYDDYYDYGVPLDCEPEERFKEYYIMDLDDDKIGNDITVSKTFYPGVYVDETSGEVLIDCPGFADTRSESHEIAIAVFMRNIFKWAKQTKILVVVNHGDVTRTGGRNAFQNLLNFVTILLKNFEKFDTSIGLVATKVKNERNSQEVVFSDEAIITQIAEFLASVQAEFAQLDPRVQVLASLLKQIGRFYPGIGIFRQPYEEGPLETITAIQTGKTKIRKMLFSNLDYTNSSETDIGFAISPASNAVVIDMCETIIDHIDALLVRLHVDFTGYYKAVVNDSQNYEQLSGVLKQESGRFQPFNLNQEAALEDQLVWFVNILAGSGAPSYLPIRSTIEAIQNQTTYLDFLKDLTSSTEVAPKEFWKSQVKKLVEYVQNLSEWYEFLMVTFNRMAQNDFQSKKATLSVNNLKHWTVFKSLVFDDLEWPSNPSVELKKSLSDDEQKSLEDVLYVVLDPVEGRALFPSPDACELVIEGHFVRSSDFEKLVKLCDGRNITAMYLFAQYTVFFDSDLSKQGSELLFGVVAPKWEVVGSQKITLTGYNGENLPQSRNGDGVAGNPGGPSGTFFGIGSEFINAAALQIYASGGTGGPGQMGRNGTDGHGDVDPNKLHDRACVQSLYYGSCGLRSYDFKLEGINYKMNQTKCTRTCSLCCPDYTVKFTIIDGPGPHNGFNGGKQGLGGSRSTSSQIIALLEKPDIQLNRNDGAPGPAGQGGKGGLGGVKNGVYTTDVSLNCFAATLTSIKECKRLPVQRGTRAKSAADGKSNVSGSQERPTPAEDHETYHIISKYRLFLANQWLRNKMKINNVDLEFVQEISANPNIQHFIDLHSLTFEFLSLEELRVEYPVSSQWLPILNLLLQTVESASLKNTNSSSSAVMANYLGAAILSRKLSIEYQFDKNLIIDLRLFLNEVSKQINMLATLNHGARLSALKTIYEQDIIVKQEEADVFLNEQFSKEMGFVESKIELAINGLLTEVSDILTQLEADQQKFVAKIKGAQDKFALNILFRFLGVVAEFLKMAGPKGKAIGIVLGAGVGIGKELTQSGSGELPHTKIPAAVEALDVLNGELNMGYQEKIRLLEVKFNVISENPLEQRVLEGAKSKFSDLVGKTNIFSIVQTELIATIDNLRKTNGIKESDLLDWVETLILLPRAEDVAAYDHLYQEIQRFSKSKRSSAEIEDLKKGLKEVEANIKKVAAYERFVEESLRGYLNTLTELMVSVKNGARQSSAITLEISRYNIQKVLQEVRTIINKYTSGFEANEELKMCVDMLDSLMRTTINIYDQIQKSNDQKYLSNLIVGIHEAGLAGLTTNDTRIDAAIRELDHKIVSNTIQNQYRRASQAFKQVVFPFAPLFLPTIQISEFGPDSTKDAQVMQLIISKLNNLQSIFNDMQSSVISGYDDQLFSFNFDEKQPFCVWNEVEHEQKITALLQGNEVAFKANVENSVASAVKFNDIRLLFVATNVSEQSELDSHLMLSHVRLTHVGNSHYKCGSRSYVISHQPQNIEMSVDIDDKGEPLSSNMAYKKIRAGDKLLSPYTVWKVKLLNRFKTEFNMNQFFGKVQLKLIGKGHYVKKNNPICNQSLEQFYQLDELNEYETMEAAVW